MVYLHIHFVWDKLFVLFAIKITFIFYNRLEHSYCNTIGDFFV